MLRQCKTCGSREPIENFPLVSQGLRRRFECSECYKARHRAYYAAHPHTYKARAKKQAGDAQYWRRLAVDAYGSKCACCGEHHPLMLALDHKDNDGCKWRKIHGNGLRLYKWLNENAYPSNFQLLCHNCNFAKHLNGGICPHQEGSTTIPQGSTAERPEAPSPQMSMAWGEDIV